MKVKFSQKHPIVASILWAICILIFYSIGGAITVIKQTSEIDTMLIQAICIFASILLALFYIMKSKALFRNYGFLKLSVKEFKDTLLFLPLVFVEIIPFCMGIRKDISLVNVVVALVFFMCVGFAEEIYFRGIIFNILKTKGIKFALVLSSIIFGVTHLGNLAGGAPIFYTALQVVFATLFGFVCAEIVIVTKSILPAIIWHFAHDYISHITNDSMTISALVILGIQCIVLIAFAVYLYNKAKEEQLLDM